MRKSDFVTTRLFGGLGNQIFQFLAGKWLATELQCELRIDTGWIKQGYTHSNSTISEFNLYGSAEELDLTSRGSLGIYGERAMTVLARKSPLYSNLSKIHAPKSPGFSDISILHQGAQLRGYYQTPRFFYDLMSSGTVTREDFDLVQPTQSYLTVLKERPREGFIALHVRGGDYLKRNSAHIQLSSDYYYQSLKLIQSIYSNLPILIFTDDHNHAASILNLNTDHIFIDNKIVTAAENLKLMSQATAIICAN